MTMYARVVSGVVQETFVLPSGFTIEECFNPELPGAWVECDGTPEVASGWSFSGSTFSPEKVGGST